MTTIERTGELRSAFLKIGWAPLVTIIGAILLCIIAVVVAVGSVKNPDDVLSTMKIIMIGGSIVSLTGYFMTYTGFSQAQKAFGATKAGDAAGTLKIIFLIFLIIGAVSFLLVLLIPDTTAAYVDMAERASRDASTTAKFGILAILVYLVIAIYSIVALFIIKSRTKKMAESTNITALCSAATGAYLGVITFFASLVAGFIGGLAADSESGAIIAGLCQLCVLVLAIYALVKWIGGWLGAATEVKRHEVEVEDYAD